MTTTISISPQLLGAVLKFTQATTKYQPVEIALKTVIERNQQEQVRADCEKLYWEGDLNSLWGSSILD
jgi:Arc/MetJ family transcription regulator